MKDDGQADRRWQPKSGSLATLAKQEEEEEAKKEKQNMQIDDAVPGPSTTTPVESMEQPTNYSCSREVILPKAEPLPRKQNIVLTKADLVKLESETVRLDDQNTIMYSLESVAATESDGDLPDSFFELTAADLRLLMRQMKESVRSMDNAPLMTTKLRELEDAKKTLNQLQYKETLLRIQFPGRLVIQSVFKPIATIESIKEFLGTFLNDDAAKEFELCK